MKRVFTDADIYEDEWYQELIPEHKLFWDYICRRAEYGIWKPNLGLMGFQLKIKIDTKKALEAFNQEKERIKILSNGRWFIPSWIYFQYPGLSRECPAHKPLFKFYEVNYSYLIDTYLIGIRNQQEIEKDKDKEKKGIVKGGRFSPPSLEEVKAAFSEKGFAPSEADKFMAYFESVGWVVGASRKPMKNWRGAVATWCGRMRESGVSPKVPKKPDKNCTACGGSGELLDGQARKTKCWCWK